MMSGTKGKDGITMMHAFLAMIFLVLLQQSNQSIELTDSPTTSQVVKSNGLRLSRDIIPNSYNITLFPDMNAKNFAFSGKSVIEITFLKATNKINLHSKNLNLINPIKLQCGSRTHNLPTSRPNNKNDILSLNIPKETDVKINSTCNLTIKFKGKDNVNNVGFFRKSYMNSKGEKKYIALTHLQPIAARQVFPCWDEPAFKANFIISVKHSSEYEVLSNMHAVASEISKDRTMKITHFAKSPKMSSYLVALFISDFVKVNGSNPKFEVWTQEDDVNLGKFVMQNSPKILKALEKYLKFLYEKLGFFTIQLLAIPRVLTSVMAMENWGLVALRDSKFLFTENLDSDSHKEYILQIITHELAHQWFGNLITVDWWDEIWLSEGFAVYFQYFIANQIEPTWRMMDMFVVDNLQTRAFAYDVNYPIVQQPEMKTRFMNIFNSMVYSKSPCIIRMISHIIGEKRFQIALQNFIKKNAFGSITSNDLIEELENVADENTPYLREAMKNWMTVPGYPVINVTRDYVNGIATISQMRFLDATDTVHKNKYWIPLNYVTRSDLDFLDTKMTDWLYPNSDSKSIKLPNQDDFVIFNKQQFGYYRVNYDERNWRKIIAYLKTENYTNIHVLNRVQLIDDAFNLANVNQLEYDIVISLLEYLKVETDFAPWRAAWRGIDHIFQYITNTDLEENFKNHVLELSTKLVAEVLTVPPNASDHVMKLKRAEALKWACKFGSKSCQSEAVEKFNKWVNDPKTNRLPPNDEEWIMCSGIQNANQTMWNKLWEIYLNDENEKILYALGCASNFTILNEYIAKGIKESQTGILRTVVDTIQRGSNHGVDFILDYMIEQYRQIRESLDDDYIRFLSIIFILKLTNEQQYNKLGKLIINLGKNIGNKTVLFYFLHSMRRDLDEILAKRRRFNKITTYTYDSKMQSHKSNRYFLIFPSKNT